MHPTYLSDIKNPRLHFTHDAQEMADYDAAIAALEKLADQYDEDLAERAAAEFISKRRFKAWRDDKELYRGKRGWRAVAGIAKPSSRELFYNGDDKPSLPGDDHVSVWRAPDGAMTYVSQPYEIDLPTMRKIIDHCDQYGMEAEIRADQSWWFPASTVAVTWTKAEAKRNKAA